MKESQPYGLRLSAIMRLTEVDLHSSRECWVAAMGEGGAGRGGKGGGEGRGRGKGKYIEKAGSERRMKTGPGESWPG